MCFTIVSKTITLLLSVIFSFAYVCEKGKKRRVQLAGWKKKDPASTVFCPSYPQTQRSQTAQHTLLLRLSIATTHTHSRFSDTRGRAITSV